MTMLLKNVDIKTLISDSRFDYIIVGDGSVSYLTERMSWSCLIISPSGRTEVIYGLANCRCDIQVAELMPCLMAMRNIRNRLTMAPKFKLRLHIITDNKGVVTQSQNTDYNFHTSGIWQEMKSYDSLFDSFWEYQPRRSNKILALVDDICSELNQSQCSIDDKINLLTIKCAQTMVNHNNRIEDSKIKGLLES